jgi:undecaprenyl-diphosphatase
MTAIQAFILGILQGVGEFLPISSSGHLVLAQKIFGVNEGALSFDIMAHFGTLISLCYVMRRRLAAYLREPFGHIPKMVALGTIPTVVIALAFGRFFRELFETGACLGVGFLFTALILYYAQSHSDAAQRGSGANPRVRGAVTRERGAFPRERGAYPRDRDENPRDSDENPREWDAGRGLDATEKRVTPGGALFVGVAQGIAVIPAVSRSGSTIAGGIICNFGRPAAVEFAFLMSIPVTLLAVAQDVLKMATGGGGEAAAAGPAEMAIGFAAAAVTGFFTARYMLTAIRKIRLTWFSIYVGALGALIILDQLFFGLVFDKIL